MSDLTGQGAWQDQHQLSISHFTVQSSLNIPVIPKHMMYIVTWFNHSYYFSALLMALCRHPLLLPLILSTFREFLFYWKGADIDHLRFCRFISGKMYVFKGCLSLTELECFLVATGISEQDTPSVIKSAPPFGQTTKNTLDQVIYFGPREKENCLLERWWWLLSHNMGISFIFWHPDHGDWFLYQEKCQCMISLVWIWIYTDTDKILWSQLEGWIGVQRVTHKQETRNGRGTRLWLFWAAQSQFEDEISI